VIGSLLWVAWALAGFGLEALALWEHNDRVLPPLTHLLVFHLPKWLLAMLIGWLAYHFLVEPQYPFLRSGL
jgi:hypothetical protein